MQATKHYDAMIILGGGRVDEETLTLLSIQRLDKGAELYSQGLANKVFALGGHYSTYRESAIRFEKTGAELRKDYLINHGVPEDAIVKVEDGRDTLYEALASRKIAADIGMHDILLVTSDKHLRRALFTFKNVFGKKFSIEGIDVPCGNLLNEQEESRYYELVQRLFETLPEDIPNPTDWDTWYKENRWFYEEQASIHKEFVSDAIETNQAYMGIKDR